MKIENDRATIEPTDTAEQIAAALAALGEWTTIDHHPAPGVYSRYPFEQSDTLAYAIGVVLHDRAPGARVVVRFKTGAVTLVFADDAPGPDPLAPHRNLLRQKDSEAHARWYESEARKRGASTVHHGPGRA